MFPLMEVLNQYDHDYHIFCDWKMWPRGDKDPELRAENTQKAISYLANKVDAVILSPALELAYWNKNTSPDTSKVTSKNASKDESKHSLVLPLFRTYLLDHAFKCSLVGKIGLLCEHADLGSAEELLAWAAKEYIPTDNQSSLWKKFHLPFAYRKKNVRMRTYFLTTFGKWDPMVRTTLKHDLRYFHDAAVDTLVPMSRGFLFYQRLVAQKTNWKKIRFHWLEAVKQSFEKIVEENSLKPSSAYSVTLYTTDTADVLLSEKKWKWILEKGGTTTLKIEQVRNF